MGKKAKRVLRLEVPFTSAAPVLTSEAMGLPRLLRRPAASFVMDVTVIDAPDGRLLRDGVVVAHRVVGGIGEWYLAAPRWAPHLPVETTVPLGASGDLPPEVAHRLRPLIRGAAIGPIAGLRCHRDEWALRDAQGEVAAVVRDERVTVRHGGVATARYREITITPQRNLTKAQRDFLLAAGLAVNATAVENFPTLQERLGAPATGLTNFPVPPDLPADPTLEEFVSTIFARHLLGIVTEELRRRAAGSDDVGRSNDLLWALGRVLRGLAPVLEPGWREATERLLLGLPWSSPAELEPALPAVLEALVGGARAPRLGDLSHRPAAGILFERTERAGRILAERCRALTVDAPDEQWAAARLAAEQLGVASTVVESLAPARLGRVLAQLDDVVAGLRGCEYGGASAVPDLEGVSAEQAFQLGVDTERARGAVAVRRAAFIKQWPDVVRRARTWLKKARKR
ncbi:MAG: hypothetical protein QM713_07105 [Arachnia sp.]